MIVISASALLPLYSIEIGIDTDNNGSELRSIKPDLSKSEKADIEALCHFSASFYTKDKKVIIKHLLTALSNNPNSSHLLAYLLENFRNYKVPQDQLKDFVATALKNPCALPLNVAAISLVDHLKNTQDSLLDIKQELAENCVYSNNPDKFKKGELNLYAGIVKVLFAIYLKKKEYAKGAKMFEDLFKHESVLGKSLFLQQAVIFYTKAAPKVSTDKGFLNLFTSTSEKFEQQKEKLLKLLHSRSAKTDNMKQALKHIAFLQKLEQLEDAKELLLVQLAKNPGEAVLWLALAEIYTKEKKYYLAKQVWINLLKNKPKSRLFRIKLAQSAFYAKDYKLAAKNYRFLLRTSHRKRAGSIIFMLALNEIQMGNYKVAWELLEMLPESTHYTEIRAHVLAALGKDVEAYKILAKMTEALPNKADKKLYLFQLAIAAKTQDKELQYKCLEQVKNKMDLEDPDIANSIGYTYADINKNLEQAEKLIRYAIKKEPERSEYLDSMAWVLYRLKKYKKAVKYIEEAISKDGKYPNSILADHAGDIYFALGDREKALKYWQLAVKLFYLGIDKNKIKEKIKKAQKPTIKS